MLEKRLELIKDIKKFCVEKLNINNNSFTEIVGQKKVYALYASPKYAIESALPSFNKTWIDRKERTEFANKCKGLDVFLANWEASENSHQITTGVLKSTKTRLIYVIIHENVHLYLRGLGFKTNKDIPLPIEEAFADTIAYNAALDYYENDNLMQHHIIRKKVIWNRVSAYENEQIRILQEAYKKNPLSGRRKLYRIREKFGKPYINNAYFLMSSFYCQHDRAMQEMLKHIPASECLEKMKNVRQIGSMEEFERVIKNTQ